MVKKIKGSKAEEFKRDVLRNVTLCQIIEPLAEKRDCTTRTVDSSLAAKLEYFIIAGPNSCWAFYDLANRVLSEGRQPHCIYDLAYEAQLNSRRNRAGGKVNFGQIALLVPLVVSQTLEYLRGNENPSVEDICGGTNQVLRNTSPEDVDYFEKFVLLAQSQADGHHKKIKSSRVPVKKARFGQKNVFDSMSEHRNFYIANEMVQGYPFSLEIVGYLDQNIKKGILRASEEVYNKLYPKRIKRYDATADMIVSAFYLMFATHKANMLLP